MPLTRMSDEEAERLGMMPGDGYVIFSLSLTNRGERSSSPSTTAETPGSAPTSPPSTAPRPTPLPSQSTD